MKGLGVWRLFHLDLWLTIDPYVEEPGRLVGGDVEEGTIIFYIRATNLIVF